VQPPVRPPVINGFDNKEEEDEEDDVDAVANRLSKPFKANATAFSLKAPMRAGIEPLHKENMPGPESVTVSFNAEIALSPGCTCIRTLTVSKGCPEYTQAADPTTDAPMSFADSTKLDVEKDIRLLWRLLLLLLFSLSDCAKHQAAMSDRKYNDARKWEAKSDDSRELNCKATTNIKKDDQLLVVFRTSAVYGGRSSSFKWYVSDERVLQSNFCGRQSSPGKQCRGN